jgi:hypothetical protein
MAMQFEELDEITARFMLQHFEAEQASADPYLGKILSPDGRAAFPDLMREAIRQRTEVVLIGQLTRPEYWNSTEPYERKGILRERAVNVMQAAERLGMTEFNTWYVRGLAARLLDEGVESCQAYRAAYDGHRARYWPEPGDPDAISIPFGPGCHHTIRRMT